MLSLRAVSWHFGGLQVLQEVELEVPAGGIFGLIGPNGAGKTTVFNLVTGLLAPSSGHIAFEGRDLGGLPPHRITRLGIARTFQNIRLFRHLSLVENVVVGAHARLEYGLGSLLLSSPRFRAAERAALLRARELLALVGLEGRSAQRADRLSYGEQRRLELARALATEPRLLLLDEPVAGMNDAEKRDLMRLIGELRTRGYTVLIIEHDMRFVMGLCERVAVLNFGRILCCDRPERVQADERVIEAYLGRDEAPLSPYTGPSPPTPLPLSGARGAKPSGTP